MPEYIEREKAYKLISEHIEKETGMYSKGRNTGLNIAKSIIHSKEQCPSADVVEVVRCKDCKHCEHINDEFARDYYQCKIRGNFFHRKPDDFCSYGELKELGK